MLAYSGMHTDQTLRGALAAQAIALEPLGRDIAQPVFRVHRFHGAAQDAVTDIRPQDGPVAADAPELLLIGQQHGGAVGLIAERRGRTPHRQLAGPCAGQFLFEQIVVRGFAKEVGLVGGEQVHRHLELTAIGVTGDQRQVILEATHAELLDARRKP